MLSDAELVRAAQGGDSTSLGVLLERYRAPLYGHALQILGYGSQAEDAVHDTFLVALRKIEQVREPPAVGGWLHMVLRNVCLMRVRGGQGEILFDQLPQYAERSSTEASAEEDIERLATREWVWTALGRLPEALRVTAMLRYFGSHSSYEEIAAILGVPVGTVSSRLVQVKVKLADALLEAADLAHNEARQLMESRASYLAAAFEEINSGRGYDLLANFSSDEPVAVLGGKAHAGRRFMLESLEGDAEAGRSGGKFRLKKVIASKDITILEGEIQNAPSNPFRCPPAVTQVHFQRGGLSHRVHFYFPPRLAGNNGA